jgi:hypothetical protein
MLGFFYQMSLLYLFDPVVQWHCSVQALAEQKQMMGRWRSSQVIRYLAQAIPVLMPPPPLPAT